MILEFGRRLRELRAAKGLSQNKLAEILGVSASTVALYENSFRMPSYDALIKIADYFAVSTDYLLDNDKYTDDSVNLSGLTNEQRNTVRKVVLDYSDLNKTVAEALSKTIAQNEKQRNSKFR
ncbi:MAG: helix-turn-helix transcriptional regulator [Abditibacteriota bacterium]|nr:helix-turn-helix transcriptional regulator [Abditibacteriota bacterium]